MEKDTIDKRLTTINGAAQALVDNAGQLIDKAELPLEQRQAFLNVIGSFVTLVSAGTVAVTELSYHVGRIADQADRDFAAAVKSEAESLAVVKADERSKRSFIGQPK